jgi:hypothetical protein
MDAITADMELDEREREFEGRGYVHADDVVNAGFVQGDTSHVAVQVVYDDLAILDDYEGVDITRVTRELKPENPLGLNLMRITVDGEPIDDPKRSSSDIQRCTDVAMKVADIQFGFDNLRSAPRLSVSATPSRIALSEIMHYGPDLSPADIFVDRQASPVRFMMYTNYAHFIDRAEVRVFETGQSLESEPLAVVPVGEHGLAEWIPQADWFRAPVFELAYVLRAYGKGGNFDETRPQPLWLVYDTVEEPVRRCSSWPTCCVPTARAATSTRRGRNRCGWCTTPSRNRRTITARTASSWPIRSFMPLMARTVSACTTSRSPAAR